MKFTLLAPELGVICLISFSIGLTGAIAADQSKQDNNVETTKAPPVQGGFDSRFVNRSKQASFVPTVGLRSPVGLKPPSAKTSLVNKSKPTFVSSGAIPPTNEQVVIKSRDINSLGPRWQSFSDYLSVDKGCDQIPLFLIFTNDAKSRFQDLRITLAKKSIGTMKDFNGQATLTRNLTNTLQGGDNLLTVQAYGPAGAKLNWKLITAKVIVNKVNPTSFALTDKVTIEGRNFSDKPNVTQVLIGDKPATIISAKSNSIQIKPPAGLLGGKTSLVVMVGNQKSAATSVTVKGAPEILGVSMISTAPGQPLTITGTGFSPIASENEVTIGPYQAEITSCSATEIECIVPLGLDSMSPVWDLPIKVKTNNMESTDPTDSGKINIQSRVF